MHQIRNSVKYVGSRHQKEFLKDLRRIYGAVSREAAEAELVSLDARWGEQYPIVIRSWRENWEQLTEFFQYTKEIQRMIYTTNTVEGYHRQIRKITKNKGGAIRHDTGETCLSGLPQRQPEVDDAAGQLGVCLATTGYKVWK